MSHEAKRATLELFIKHVIPAFQGGADRTQT
jgi:hypothetical protein